MEAPEPVSARPELVVVSGGAEAREVRAVPVGLEPEAWARLERAAERAGVDVARVVEDLLAAHATYL
jgi:hypothetical protein